MLRSGDTLYRTGLSRIGGLAALAGALILTIATLLHPMGADPNDAAAAFAEYAADRIWRASHLGQLAGISLMGAGLIALTGRLRHGRAGPWARLGALATMVGVALAGALQAVDGLALKTMVDRWAAAAPEHRPAVFEAAFAVRQIEIGLGSVMALFFGLAALLFGVAQLCDRETSNWLGSLGIASGAMVSAGGLVQAHAGFAAITVAFSMPGGALLTFWVLLVGLSLMRGRTGVADRAQPTVREGMDA